MGIDDNEAYNLAWWMTLCKKYDPKPTWWLITSNVNSRSGNGGAWEGWKKILAEGYEVGSHSVDHLNHNPSQYVTWLAARHRRGFVAERVEAFLQPPRNNQWTKFDAELGYVLKDSIQHDGCDGSWSVYR